MKKTTLKSKIRFSKGTPFQQKVWAATEQIPYGRVSTYKDIARAVGCKSSRAVGQALNKNPYSPAVPCHRVVMSDGRVGGFADGVKKKISMLQKECIRIEDGKIEEFDLKKIEKFK